MRMYAGRVFIATSGSCSLGHLHRDGRAAT